jgi:hypothetical protein
MAQQFDEMRQQYMNTYNNDDIMSFYQIAINKKNFDRVYVNGENPNDNYFLNIEKRARIMELIENNNINKNDFGNILLMLTNEELIYIGF